MKKALFLAAGCSLLGLAACSADNSDFQKDAEKFIKDNKDVEKAVAGDVTAAKCDKPAKVEKGQTFNCTGTLADGMTVNFVATITGDKSYVVDLAQPGGGATTSSSVVTDESTTSVPASTG